MARGRVIQKTKTKHWEDIPDDHVCKKCNRTKHDGVNFKVNEYVHSIKPNKLCNFCYTDLARAKKGIKVTFTDYEAKEMRRIEIREGFKEYFKSKET